MEKNKGINVILIGDYKNIREIKIKVKMFGINKKFNKIESSRRISDHSKVIRGLH